MTSPRPIDAVQQTLDQLNARRKEVFMQMEPLQKEMKELYEQISKLREERDTLLTKDVPPEKLGWGRLAYMVGGGDAEGLSSMVLYRYFTNAVHDQLGLWHSGYYPDTGEANLQVMITQGEPESVRRTCASVHMLRTQLTPHTRYRDTLGELTEAEGRDMVWFGIFYGEGYSTPQLWVRPDGTRAMVVTKSGSRAATVHADCKTVEEAVQYIHDHMPYRKLGDE